MHRAKINSFRGSFAFKFEDNISTLSVENQGKL